MKSPETDKRFIFKSQSCEPLSPSKNQEIENDHLYMIYKQMGKKMTGLDVGFIQKEPMAEYMNMIYDQVGQNYQRPLKYRFPQASKQLLRILESMLEFNPHFRLTAKELL